MTFVGDIGKDYRMFGATIRNPDSGTGWALIAGHGDAGIGAITALTDGRLSVGLSFTGSVVGSANITMDETLSAAGVFCGASIGTDEVVITFFQPLSIRMNGVGSAKHAFSNAVVDTTLSASGVIKITHEVVSHNDAGGWPISMERISNGGNSKIIVTNVTKTGFELHSFNSSGVSEAWSGSNQLMVTRPNIKIKAQDIKSNKGNIWILGFHEI